MGANTTTTVNGCSVSVSSELDRTLLDFLRHELALKGTRFGCGEGSCGACNVLVDGRVMTACNTPLWAVADKNILTIEGLKTTRVGNALQGAFINEQAMQCGYCISGILISAAALLSINPDPADADIRAALQANLCRCGAHNRIVRAVLCAAKSSSGQISDA